MLTEVTEEMWCAVMKEEFIDDLPQKKWYRGKVLSVLGADRYLVSNITLSTIVATLFALKFVSSRILRFLSLITEQRKRYRCIIFVIWKRNSPYLEMDVRDVICLTSEMNVVGLRSYAID